MPRPHAALCLLVFLLLPGASAFGATTAKAPRPGTSFKDCRDCPTMKVVPAGAFDMGAVAGDAGATEAEMPRHRVTIPADFAVGVDEVTRAQFAKFIDETRYDAGHACFTHESGKWQETAGRNWREPGFAQGPNHPVVCVSWNDAKEYARWLSAKTGKPYRLLTESEWEYIARAGNAAHGGLDIPPHDFANYGAEVHCCTPLAVGKDKFLQTAPVGSFKADSLGLHDVRGNVWELLEDCYNDSYTDAPTDGSARSTGCSLADRRSVRGGGWADPGELLRLAYRLRSPADKRYFTLGFRVARSLD